MHMIALTCPSVLLVGYSNKPMEAGTLRAGLTALTYSLYKCQRHCLTKRYIKIQSYHLNLSKGITLFPKINPYQNLVAVFYHASCDIVAPGFLFIKMH